MTCRYCEENPNGECEGEIRVRHAMTAYHFEGEKNSPEDPNRDFYACDSCYAAYVEHWTWMWEEYYNSVR